LFGLKKSGIPRAAWEETRRYERELSGIAQTLDCSQSQGPVPGDNLVPSNSTGWGPCSSSLTKKGGTERIEDVRKKGDRGERTCSCAFREKISTIYSRRKPSERGGKRQTCINLSTFERKKKT